MLILLASKGSVRAEEDALPCGQQTTHHPSNPAPTNGSFGERYQRGWRRIVLNFAPSWFSVNMGTGIVSILLHNLPYNAFWLSAISIVIFGVNVLLFFIFLFLSLARYILFPGMWRCMIRHPAESLFLGMSNASSGIVTCIAVADSSL
jgi:Voltage-dependent anion channel